MQKFTASELNEALCKYEDWYNFHRGSSSFNQVHISSAGIQGWIDYNPDAMLEVSKHGNRSVTSSDLCCLLTRKALIAANELPQWEKLVVTVDSGASDTVIPSSVALNISILYSSKSGD